MYLPNQHVCPTCADLSLPKPDSPLLVDEDSRSSRCRSCDHNAFSHKPTFSSFPCLPCVLHIYFPHFTSSLTIFYYLFSTLLHTPQSLNLSHHHPELLPILLQDCYIEVTMMTLEHIYIRSASPWSFLRHFYPFSVVCSLSSLLFHSPPFQLAAMPVLMASLLGSPLLTFFFTRHFRSICFMTVDFVSDGVRPGSQPQL